LANTDSRKVRIQGYRDIAEFAVVPKWTIAFPRKVASAEAATQAGCCMMVNDQKETNKKLHKRVRHSF
jgi:hypothetical protein